MTDTMRLVLWIVVALVVIALIIWFFVASSRRRQQDMRRGEAAELRAKVQERLPEMQGAEDRASVTGQIAEDARAEAVARADEASRLEQQAQEHHAQAEAARQERETLEREADRIDPDVRTDDEGYRVGESGQPLEERGAFGRPGGAPGSVAAGSAAGGAGVGAGVGVAAAGGALGGARSLTDDDDEPDLADAENPFAGQDEAEPEPEPESARPHQVPVEGEPERPTMEHEASDDDADWVNSPVDKDVDDELEASAVEDSQAEDWINGPLDEERADGGSRDEAASEADWVNSPVDEDVDEELEASAAEDSQAADWINGPEDAAPEQPTGGVDSAQPADVQSSDADWVNSPVDEDVDEELEASAAEDSQAADWINGPDDADTTVEAPAASQAVTDPMEVSEVSVPALEDTDDVLVDGGTPSDDPGDHRGQPWSTSFGSRPPESSEPPAEELAPEEPTDQQPAAEESTAEESTNQQPAAEESTAEESTADPGPIEHSDDAPLLDDSSGTDEGGRDAEAQPATEPEAEAAAGPTADRRISTFDEVNDGGYGIGSAAPLEDRAQPLGHAVKAWRESNTFRSPGSPGYDDAEPDVWFFNEEAARRAGFGPAGE